MGTDHERIINLKSENERLRVELDDAVQYARFCNEDRERLRTQKAALADALLTIEIILGSQLKPIEDAANCKDIARIALTKVGR